MSDESESMAGEEPPSECGSCGATLGGRWAEDDDGNVMCLDCAGVQ
jgi:hypothetical protein